MQNEITERAAFEKWAAEWWPNSYPPLAAWTGWKARAALAQAGDAQPVAWPVHPDQTSPMTVGPEEFFEEPLAGSFLLSEEFRERLLDAQQDINLAANCHMDQALCDASALIDEIDAELCRIVARPSPSEAVEARRLALEEAAAYHDRKTATYRSEIAAIIDEGGWACNGREKSAHMHEQSAAAIRALIQKDKADE